MQLLSQCFGAAWRHQAGKFFDVKTGTKGTLPLAGDDGHPHLRIAGKRSKTFPQFSHHLRM
jgi:hypothetical protein